MVKRREEPKKLWEWNLSVSFIKQNLIQKTMRIVFIKIIPHIIVQPVKNLKYFILIIYNIVLKSIGEIFHKLFKLKLWDQAILV